MFDPNRRRFLRYLASSPLVAHAAAQETPVITDPKQAINIMDFEPAARKALPPAHFGYLATGVEDDATLRANSQALERIQLRPRRLIDVATADMRVELFGTTWDTPIILAPVGNQKAFHEEGEVPVVRAAKARKALAILSTVTNTSVEDIARELGRPPWYQLYATSLWEVAERLVRRAENAGCPVLVWTVDTTAGRRTETFERTKKLDYRKCLTCHTGEPGSFYRRKPMFDGIDSRGLSMNSPSLTWEHLARLKKMTRMKVIVKGIETREDAVLCLDNGADGIVVSNHGGRAEESGRGTMECLPEVIDAVGGRVPVLVDGGFRRGAHVFKALAMGARAVCIGRPYIWGLAAFGQAGVEQVLSMMRDELQLTMKQCGTRSIAEISRAHVMVRS